MGQRRLDEALAECKRAIACDPDFGSPYNDIGGYLMEMGRDDEAIPWLEQAKRDRWSAGIIASPALLGALPR